MANYREATEDIERLARDLIDEHHSELADARILFMFRDKPFKKNGKITLGKARKLSSKEKAITALDKDHDGYDFMIEIAEMEYYQLEGQQQKALIDHELSHCGKKPDGSWTIYEHDFTGFHGVMRRHGFWSPDLRKHKMCLTQMELPFNDYDNDSNLRVAKG